MIALLLTALLQDPTTLRFDPPAKAKADDIKKAAAALEARCKAYGYDGVTAKVVAAKATKGKAGGPSVELACKDGFTEAMRDTIYRNLCGTVVQSVEIRFARYMERAESDRFPEPRHADVAKAKAPPGVKWLSLRFMNASGDQRFVMPFYENGSLVQGDFTISFDGGAEKPRGDMKIELSESGVKKWASLPKEIQESKPMLILNGSEVVTSNQFDPLTEKDGKVTGHRYTQVEEAVCFANSIPFILTPAK